MLQLCGNNYLLNIHNPLPPVPAHLEELEGEAPVLAPLQAEPPGLGGRLPGATINPGPSQSHVLCEHPKYHSHLLSWHLSSGKSLFLLASQN